MIGAKCWLIVCMDDGNIDVRNDHSFIRRDMGRPKYIHHYKDNAERELLRLSKEHPHSEFYLFEAVSTAREQITGTGIIEIVDIEYRQTMEGVER